MDRPTWSGQPRPIVAKTRIDCRKRLGDQHNHLEIAPSQVRAFFYSDLALLPACEKARELGLD
jgi:hypothetical protein